MLRPATLILGLLGLLGLGIMYWVNWARGQNLAATHARVIQAGLSGFLCGVIAWRARSF